MMINSQIVERNKNYKYFGEFKKAIQNQPALTYTMLMNHASSELLNSKYMQNCKNLFAISLLNDLFKVMLGSSAAVFAMTLLLHRRRSWVLSSPGILRSIMFKYVPVWFCYGTYTFSSSVKIPTNLVGEDFGEIQQQFWSVYSQHGERIRQRLKLSSIDLN